jgi:hypothetical protein
MEGRLLERDMIFYNPGKKGTAFTFAAEHFVTQDLLQQTVDHLEYETEGPINYIEERRTEPRATQQ